MTLPPITIVWCDISFENKNSYQSMQDEFNETTTATPKKELNSIDMAIFNEAIEQLRSNDVPLVPVQTPDDAIKQIEKYKNNKIFVICSGTVGQNLVPKIVRQYPLVHNFYIFAHNIALHLDWADNYPRILRMFNFPTVLLVRLTRDISAYFIEQGKMYLQVDAPQDALTCFNHARNLEIQANERDKGKFNSNTTEPSCSHIDFREHLDMLEGDGGLISQAKEAVRAKGYSLEILELNRSHKD